LADAQDINRNQAAKFYTAAKSSRQYYESFLVSNCLDKNVLEYGCGSGSYSFFLARHLANKVTGIDISAAAIESARAQAKVQNLGKAAFLVMDAEATEFDDDCFDVICGTGILHHLNLGKALKEIARILRPGGSAIFIEPMGYNQAINIYRRLTPHLRVKDEHPLKYEDLRLIKSFFQEADFKFFHFFSLLAVPFRNMAIFPFLLNFLDYIDGKLAALLPFLRIFYWQVVITLKNQDKSRSLGV